MSSYNIVLGANAPSSMFMTGQRIDHIIQPKYHVNVNLNAHDLKHYPI